MWDIDSDSAEPGLYVKEIEFNDGSKVQDIKRNDIIVLVGANNVGKSQTLKDIFNGLGDEPASILKSIHTCKTGQVQEIINLSQQPPFEMVVADFGSGCQCIRFRRVFQSIFEAF